jgi:PAS domain S-box-containing protein
MTRHSNESDRKSLFLRRDAENRLREGSAPPTSGSPLDKDALARLYVMASDPKRSSDALRLLQELQVHQVELDLQREELENAERETNRELTLYRALFELMPCVCLVATTEGRIVEGNPAAASLLRTRRSELLGRSLHDFVKQESHTSWSELLEQLKAGEQAVSCEVVIGTRGNEAITLGLSGSFLPEGDVLLFGVVNPEPVLNDLSKQQTE